jgi:hypothetical protein
LTVLGAGPIAAGVTAGGAIAAVVVLSTFSTPPEPSRQQPQVRAPKAAEPTELTANAPSPAPQPNVEAARSAEPRREVRARSSSDRMAGETRGRPDVTPALPTGETDEATAIAPIAPAPTAKQPERAAQREPDARGQREQPSAAPAQPEPVAEAAQRMNRAMTDAELAEMREIARAKRLLTDDPKRALALTRAMEAGFPEGRFREERAYLEVMALFELERTDEMRAKAAAFLRAYPAGLYSGRVRKALAGRGD